MYIHSLQLHLQGAVNKNLINIQRFLGWCLYMLGLAAILHLQQPRLQTMTWQRLSLTLQDRFSNMISMAGTHKYGLTQLESAIDVKKKKRSIFFRKVELRQTTKQLRII